MAIERAAEPFLADPFIGPIEVQIEDESPYTEDGGMVIDLDPMAREESQNHGDNLAEFMSDSDLSTLANDLIEDFEEDRKSRADWEKTYIQGLDLLGLKFESRSKPWDGACGVFHPMLAEAVVRFQAQTAQEIFPATGPAKTTVVGTETTEKTAQSGRVQEYLNYVSTKKMVEYRTETERLLFSLPIAGSAFRKIYHDSTLERPCAMFVPAEDFVVSYGTSDLATCERATHIMKRTANKIRKEQVSGFYRDVDLPDPAPDDNDIRKKYDEMTGNAENFDIDSRYTLLEMQVDVDLVGFEDEYNGKNTEIALPYVITIDFSSQTVLSIRRNWLENDPYRLKRDHFVHYQYIPGLGFYGFGLVHMIGGLTKSATSLLRQLVDAGTLANLPAGLKARGLRIKGDDSPLMPGEFRDVDIPSGAIRDNIAFLPYKEPSSVLYQLLGDIVQEGRRFASAADLKASDMNGEAPVGTTLALLEREMKVLSAVQARIHAAMGRELVILADIVKTNGPDKYPYEIEGEYTVREDFDDRVDVLPVSDPNAGTMAQRIMQYQAALQLAAQAPQMYDMPFLHRQMLATLGIADAERVVPLEDDLKPTDPVTENMNILNTKPVKAFLYEDHEAHITTHMSMMKHPQLIAAMKDNPLAQTIQAAMFAHITEHVAMGYRQKIEQELGVHLPDPEETLPEDIELRLSRLVAPAAAQLTGKALQQAQAEKNAEQQKDPIIQMQQKEVAIKEGKARADKETDDKKLALDTQKALADKDTADKQIASREKIEQDKIQAKVATDSAKLQVDKDKQAAKEMIDGFEIGLELADRIIDEDESGETDNE